MAKNICLRTRMTPQWNDDYPNEKVIEKDIRLRNSYVGEIEGKIVGTFALTYGYNPVYETLI